MVRIKEKMGKRVVVIVEGKRHFTLLHHWRKSEAWVRVSLKEFWKQRIIYGTCKLCFYGSILNFFIPGTMRKWLKVKE